MIHDFKKFKPRFSFLLLLLLSAACIFAKESAENRLTLDINLTFGEFLLVFALFALILFVIVPLLLITHKKNLAIEYDNVTGLPTFAQFEKKVRHVLKSNRKNKYMILLLNANNFRIINDTYGIVLGNEILRKIGAFFERHLERNEFVCRFYADNFVLFLKRPEFFWDIEERVFNMTDVDHIVRGYLPAKYNFSFSSSVYHIENPNDDVESMIDKANLAMKLCKDNFLTHRVIEYTPEMKESYEWNREITLSMEESFANREFEVFYQPKFSFKDESIIGAEALIRWNSPRKGFLMPGKFVPLFEENGFIEKIDKFVLTKVAQFLEEWNKNRGIAKWQPLTISFNLSRSHLQNPNLISELKKIVAPYDIGSNKIEVELTERIMIDNYKHLVKVMKEIKKAGFSVSVDDFGSGYSSLNLLKNMPADVIKLDKDFLYSREELERNNSKEKIIITSVIEMAKKLNITTVAEGVETKDQCEMLKGIGCDIAQGFYYAKPMQEKNFMELLGVCDAKTG